MEYEGDVAELNTRPLTAVLLKGLLTPLMESVNMVNAPTIARERDIKVSEVKRGEAADYHTLIKVTVQTESRSRTIAGSLFGGDKPRLVAIDGVPVEAEVTPTMLYIRNEDKPGFIGRLGVALGDAGVNIASFHLGRVAPGVDAVCLVSVDQPVDGPLLDRISALPSVVRAELLRF